MESLSSLLAFVQAAEDCSYVAAGEKLGVSASAIGKSVARLEDKLGVRLLNRTTRRISLTEEGALFFERCRRIVNEIEEAENEISRLTETPSGKLRISLPAIGYRMVMPILPEFSRRYPEIELDLDFNDRMIDLIAEGFDAVIRSGELSDSRLKARPIGSYRFRLVASPQYLNRHGTPEEDEALNQHTCLRYRFPTTGLLQPWADSHQATVATKGRNLSNARDRLSLPVSMTLNNVEALINAAEAGMGIACLPDFAVKESLASGKLIQVLPDYPTQNGSFSILWSSSRHLLPKLRVFVDFLIDHLKLGE